MKTIKDIEPGKCFTLFQDGSISSFIRLNELEHDGNNAHCIMSSNPTYDKSVSYFIQHDLEVVPTLRK